MQAAYQEQVTHELVPRPRAQALLAGAGIVLALIVSAVNGMLFQQLEKAGATHLGALAFVLAFVAPGVVALVAIRMPNIHVQRSLTFAAAIAYGFLAILAMFTVGIFFLAIAAGLVVCVLATRPPNTDPTPVSAYLLTMVVMSSLVLALGLITLRGPSACWSSTDPGWHVVSSINQGAGQGIAAGGSVTCTSQLTDSASGLYGLAFLALAAIAIAVGSRIVRPEPVE
ncbi:MAG TPA: hypothetical protein PK819_12605 [Thermomicrobiales bacterium]|nr:hypothetical protein [Thermomicrobiales bacterium]